MFFHVTPQDDSLFTMLRTNVILCHLYLGFTFLGLLPIVLRHYQYHS
jgi:hypothetical protein